MDTHKRSNTAFQILSFLFLALCFLGTVNFFRLKKNNTITADESSEMVLGNLLAEENSLVSKNWYYSTELEVLNTNVFYSFFFHITDNWHRVRLYSTISMYLVMLLVYYGMSRVFRFRHFFALSAAVFFIPFSSDYYHWVLKGIYYFPVVITSIFTLVLAEYSLSISGRKSFAFLFFSFIFSVVIGLGGMRQLFFTYIPLMAASGIMMILKKSGPKQDKWFIFSAISFLGSFIGYAINAGILSKIFSFDTWGSIHFRYLDFNRLGEVLNGFLATFGYSTENLFSSALLDNAVCAAWLLLAAAAVWYALKNSRKISEGYTRLALFILCSFVIYVVFYSFTTMYYLPRYNLPIICAAIPLVVMFLDQSAQDKRISAGFLFVLAAATAASGLNYYVSTWDTDANVEIRRIAKTLVSEGYYNGYATFWNGNNLTEFSNGQIEVWSPVDGSHDQGIKLVYDIDQTYKWLQKVSHDTTHPDGKIFLFFTSGENKNNNWKANLKKAEVIYRSKDYVIYGFEDYEHLIDTLYPGYDFVFGDNTGVENGHDENGRRELYAGGVSYGSLRTLWPGNYEISVKGRNLSEAEVSCVYGPEERSIYITPVQADDETLSYTMELSEKTLQFNVHVKNISGNPDSVVEIDTISVRRAGNSQ